MSGIPTNKQGIRGENEFIRLLKQRDAVNNLICITLLSRQEDVIEFYHGLKANVPYLIVMNGYECERKEVLDTQENGIDQEYSCIQKSNIKNSDYNIGIHAVRLLLSGIITEYELMNRRKMLFDHNHNLIKMSEAISAKSKKESQKNCCVIL